jgi:hypothetical protein
MCHLRSAVRSIIDTEEACAPIDVYAVAQALHACFPEKDMKELAQIVSEIAVRKSGRSLLWERR